MPLISGFQCNCCGLIFDFPAYVRNDEMCPSCHCKEFTTVYQKEEFQCNCCGLTFDFPAYVGDNEICPECHCEEFTTVYQKE